jgi:c-di-GMP-binding flagellar brake protein YcgR
MAEHRLFVRYTLKGTVLIQQDGSTRTLKGELVDLGFKGCAAYCTEALELGKGVKFFVKSDDNGAKFQGTAKIRYCQPIVRNGVTFYRAGIEFANVDSEQVRDVLLYLQKLAKERDAS